MSIIHEALKKTGRSVVSDASKTPQAVEKEGVVRITPVSRTKASAGWKPYLVLAILIIASAPLFAGRILHPGQGQAAAPRALGQFSIEETPITPSHFAAARLPQNPAGQPFALSGVVYDGADSYCLINGLVLKEGQKVGGATVTKIAQDTVTLDLGGQTITLSSAG